MEYDYYGSYGHEKHANHTYFDKLKQDYTFDFPKQHDVIKAECEATRSNVAVFDMSYFGQHLFYAVYIWLSEMTVYEEVMTQ